VPASSLVFVAIIVGWAVYLLPQWVRRREALGESRGRDRHSSGLRVLSRRQRQAAGPSTVPLLPDPQAMGEPVVDPLAEPAPDAAAPAVPIRSPRLATPSPAAVAARRRARVLSWLLVLTATAWTASVAVPAVATVGWIVTGLLAADLVALVVSGRHRAVRRAQVERDRRHRALQARRSAASRRAAAEGAAAAAAAVAAAPEAGTAVPSSTPVTPPRPERASERVARELDEGASGAMWTPVPVPPPTYTMKATAPRPEPAPLDLPGDPPPQPTEPAGSTPGSAPAAATGTDDARGQRPWDDDRSFADELDLDAVLARRRAVNG